jgi:hypothetical protein
MDPEDFLEFRKDAECQTEDDGGGEEEYLF